MSKNINHRWLKWEDTLLLDLCGAKGTLKDWLAIERTMKIPAPKCKSRYHQLTRGKKPKPKIKIVNDAAPKKQPVFYGQNIQARD